MRNAFADEVTKLGMIDPRIVLLTGDIVTNCLISSRTGVRNVSLTAA